MPGSINAIETALDDFDDKFKIDPSDACSPQKLSKARFMNRTRLELCRHRLMGNENM